MSDTNEPTKTNVIRLPPKWICGECLAASNTKSATLCATCARAFRLLIVPRDVPDWTTLEKLSAESGPGVGIEQMFTGLLIRIANQKREIAKLQVALDKAKENKT